MALQHWMSWEGGVDLIAKTSADLEMPNVILHVARMVHTPVGSAPGGMVFWQPDPAAAPLAFGFVSDNAAVAGYFAEHIFKGTPFEGAPWIEGEIIIEISAEDASARVEIPGFVLQSHLSQFAALEAIRREPLPATPFHQQGLEAAAGHACFKVNGEKIEIVVPDGGAVLAPCGIYAR